MSNIYHRKKIWSLVVALSAAALVTSLPRVGHAEFLPVYGGHYLIHVPATAVPEPTSVAIMIAAAVFLARRHRFNDRSRSSWTGNFRFVNTIRRMTAAMLLLCVGATPSANAASITYDFRSAESGGNVGDVFNGQQSASEAVGGVAITGSVTQHAHGRREFNFTAGSSDLGIGVHSDAGSRNTQLDVGEQISFEFDRTVRIDSVTLQVFFLTASDGLGGPVSQVNDEITISLGASTVTITSPLQYAPPNPATFTIDISSHGFATANLNLGESLVLAPAGGDGVRLRSITIAEVPEPASLALLALGLPLLVLRNSRRVIAHHSAKRKRNPMTKYWTVLITASLATLLAPFAPALVARADIFKWEYINPANPGEGKQPSTMLVPDGAGAYVGPGANLSNGNLTMAYLIGADLGAYYDDVGTFYYSDLTGANLSQADLTNAYLYNALLTNANFSQANLANASFYFANLTGANLTGAEVRGANFERGDYGGGITPAQLYSTASYQAHDLSGIGLGGNDLTGVNLAGQNLTNSEFRYAVLSGANLSQANLTNANFYLATLSGANLTGAEVRGAHFYRYEDSHPGSGITVSQLQSTASYQAHDLSGIGLQNNILTGVDLAGHNLTNADFSGATLSGANLTGAEVRGANFNYTGVTAAQLYSTASYQAHDLAGIGLSGSNFAGGNLAGQNLTNARFHGATLTNSNFSQANLTNADFYGYGAGANLTGANLSQANLTNANFYLTLLTGANLTGAEVRGANFNYTGVTAEQIYSTASYQAHDLTGIGLSGSSFAGGNLASQNLTNADFGGATLTNANFSQTNLTNSYFTAATLTGANLSQANLTNAGFTYATLSGANLTGAQVRGANFDRTVYGSGITPAQLYSTASYLAHDLTGIRLNSNDLTGVNLAGQNLTNATFYVATLSAADFSQANLTNATFYGASLAHANFSQAILTNANFSYYQVDESTIFYANLTGANFSQTNLTNLRFDRATLTNANFSQANLTNAVFEYATLSGANLTGAEVRGANFDRTVYGSGITAAQLYSTASYLAHDLTGIRLGSNDLAGLNLAGQILTNASFAGATLTNANFSQTNLTNLHFAAATMTGANLSQANLTNANFYRATLTGANVSGATVWGATFDRDSYNSAGTGITTAQLYSTASYQAHDLTGIGLAGNNLAGVNLASQNLTNARFHGATLTNADLTQTNLRNADFSTSFGLVVTDLTGANLSGAHLTNANFSGFESCDEYGCYGAAGANLTGATLSGADARGASFYLATLTGANTSNLIQSNGHIAGLNLTAGKSLVVRDYDGNLATSPQAGPLPIVVDQSLAMNATGTLRLVFDADPWDSTISFAPGIPVARGGTLELTFAPDVNVAAQNGRTIDLFDWIGVTPSGTFNVSSPYTWNLSKLYTTGEVTLASLPAIPGDFNQDGTVDAADYVVWRKNPGGIYTQDDFNIWRANFGMMSPGSGSAASANAAVPESSTAVLLILAAGAGIRMRGRHIVQRGPKTH